jgi:hypothetical protein
MGSGSWSGATFASYTTASNYSSKSTDEIFTRRQIDPSLDPKGKIRESRDSADNPNSTPVILALDVTGSMDRVLDAIVRDGLNSLCKQIFERKPISDPHVMCMGIGDEECGDEAPLQVSQFEADIRILTDLEKIWLERGGGGNGHESYLFPLYFAATATRIDSYEKRQKKGFLFTIGDEEPQPSLAAGDIDKIMGTLPQTRNFSAAQVLAMATKQWNVFHVIIEEGSHYRGRPTETARAWRELMGQRVISLPDYKMLPEAVIAAMQHTAGVDKAEIVKQLPPAARKNVEQAMRYLP